jgi:hypothetical protein
VCRHSVCRHAAATLLHNFSLGETGDAKIMLDKDLIFEHEREFANDRNYEHIGVQADPYTGSNRVRECFDQRMHMENESTGSMGTAEVGALWSGQASLHPGDEGVLFFYFTLF